MARDDRLRIATFIAQKGGQWWAGIHWWFGDLDRHEPDEETIIGPFPTEEDAKEYVEGPMREAVTKTMAEAESKGAEVSWNQGPAGLVPEGETIH